MTPTNHHHTLKKTIQLLTQSLTQLQDTLQELNLNQNGFPTSKGTGTTPQLNDDGKPQGLDRYLNQPDPAAQDLTTLTTIIQRTHNNALQLHRITTQWATPSTAATHQRGTGCLACLRYVPNTDTDRIRSGLCMACHRSWTRSQLDRGDWMLQRKKQLHTTGGDTPHPADPIQDKGTSAIATNQTTTL